MGNHKERPLEGTVVTAEALEQILRDTKPPAIPQLDLLISRYEELLEQVFEQLDLTTREGFFGELIGGIDYRIDKKAGRIQRLDRLMEGFAELMGKAELAEQKIRAINRECYEQYIDRVRAARTLLEEQERLMAIRSAARRQEEIEEAKAEAEIEKYKRQARDAQQPPSSPAPPAEPADEFELKRQVAYQTRKFECELKLDGIEAQVDFQDKLARSALARIVRIFAEPETRRAQKCCRILNLRDTYGIDESLLPAGVLELLQEEE